MLASRTGDRGTNERAPAQVRLGEHRVEATVDDRVAHVTVRQRFLNRTGFELEGTWLFPLPPDASVGSFRMTMGGRMVDGEVLDADKARSIYRAIVQRRRDPGLLEYVGRGLFRASVFPIPARGHIDVELAYDQVLREEGGVTEFAYPLATDRLHPEPVDSVLVDVTIRDAAAMSSIHCPSHRVSVTRNAQDDARVVYESSKGTEADDFVLWSTRSDGDVTVRVVSHKPAGEAGTFLTMLAPPHDERTVVPRDVLYVIDTSGSMQGRKMGQARAALKYGIGLLREGDRFNVLAFATDARLLQPALLPVTDETRKQAGAWIDGLSATGGTALADAVALGLSLGDTERLFLVVLVTDGKPTVGERDAGRILERIAEANRGRARVFTFGVGKNLDVGLLDRIAEATGGVRDYVAEHERIDAMTARLFHKIDRPVITDVSLEFGPGIEQVYPRRVGDLYDGDELVLLGRYTETGNRTVTLRGRQGDREVVQSTEVELADGARAAFLPRLWAQRKIAFLLDELRLHPDAGEELVDEVKRLGTRFGIVTPYTAGLVVEDAPSPGSRSGIGGAFRGPDGGVPPGLREPSGTPTPPAPATPGRAYGPACPPPPVDSSRPLFFQDGSERSKKLRDDKEKATVDKAGTVRDAAGRTFRLDATGRWTDTAWDGEGEPERVEAFSDRYWELLDAHEELNEAFALGGRVLIVLDGAALEVFPSE